MSTTIHIDTSFDFRRDTPPGKDPDVYSSTLRMYHQRLWSKRLPNGMIFSLDASRKGAYLHHQSVMGEFSLSSDSAIHSFSQWPSMAHIISRLKPEVIEEFRSTSYTIGGMVIFPSNRVDGKSTINGARGMHPLIKDRIDLTLECIRRHYINEHSPLSEVLDRYKDFFALFQNFRGYVEFFLLQDLVDEEFSTVRFLMPFNDFVPPVVPTTLEEYLAYKESALRFVNRRNRRILESIELAGSTS